MNIEFLKKSKRVSNKNLVIVRAGSDSLHRKYFDIMERNWDRMIICYEEPNPFDFDNSEFVLKGGLSKWTDLSDLILLNFFDEFHYEYILVSDDDLIPSRADSVNFLFMKALEYNLDISQPSLTHDSYYTWLITIQSPGFHVRYTNFVECMCPVFSKKALLLAKNEIKLAVSGCGLDLIFSEILNKQENKMGIIDDVSFKHTKPIDPNGGAFYKHLQNNNININDEISNFMNRFNLTRKNIFTTGGVPVVQSITI